MFGKTPRKSLLAIGLKEEFESKGKATAIRCKVAILSSAPLPTNGINTTLDIHRSVHELGGYIILDHIAIEDSSNSGTLASARRSYLIGLCIFVAMDFSESDKGKRVVDQQGNTIGAVDDIRDGNAYVKKSGEEKVIDAITSSLGWDDSAIQELESKHVDSIDDTQIKVREL
ncbi:hypothetical protein [Halococcus salsus]|uniref:hypothetical protein n=1 Tax=Halococcus salsus TaxID=2162894 RepID=UPI0013582AEB|nr:hypothetical protein [Halococcus salsus]